MHNREEFSAPALMASGAVDAVLVIGGGSDEDLMNGISGHTANRGGRRAISARCSRNGAPARGSGGRGSSGNHVATGSRGAPTAGRGGQPLAKRCDATARLEA